MTTVSVLNWLRTATAADAFLLVGEDLFHLEFLPLGESHLTQLGALLVCVFAALELSQHWHIFKR